MQRAIGHKSSSSREGDYQLVGARPAWAARLVKKTADDQFRQFEERIATFVSARFAEEAYTQQQREAMYAHCLETQISTLGNEWVGRLRQEMADTAQQNLATVREVQQKAGIDMDALARDAGQAVLGVREEIGDLRRRTAAEVEAVRAAGRNT